MTNEVEITTGVLVCSAYDNGKCTHSGPSWKNVNGNCTAYTPSEISQCAESAGEVVETVKSTAYILPLIYPSENEK